MKNHCFHLVKTSPWPFFTAISSFIFVSGLAFYMHRITYGLNFLVLGLSLILMCVFFWFSEVINEATYLGEHTLVVRKGLKLGFWLFITSEIMLFFGFFWAFFHSSFSPSDELGNLWPPDGIKVIYTYGCPLVNTLILITSGMSATWLHKAIKIGSYKESIDSFLLTLILGVIFLFLQINEYYEAAFNLNDGIFGCTFYLLTGLHGCHVIVGVIFLIICFLRLLLNHFTVKNHLGLLFAIWYWHFVDIVWIVLFFTVYLWGGY